MRIVMNLTPDVEGTRSSVRCRLRLREGLWGWELMSGMGPGAMGMDMLIEVRGFTVVNVNVGRRDGTTMIVAVRRSVKRDSPVGDRIFQEARSLWRRLRSRTDMHHLPEHMTSLPGRRCPLALPPRSLQLRISMEGGMLRRRILIYLLTMTDPPANANANARPTIEIEAVDARIRTATPTGLLTATLMALRGKGKEPVIVMSMLHLRLETPGRGKGVMDTVIGILSASGRGIGEMIEIGNVGSIVGVEVQAARMVGGNVRGTWEGIERGTGGERLGFLPARRSALAELASVAEAIYSLLSERGVGVVIGRTGSRTASGS